MQNRAQQMTLGQLLLMYALAPILVLTFLGIRRARRARAGWIAWSPILLYGATVVVSFVVGWAMVAIAFPRAAAQVVVSALGLATAVSGPWLFFKFKPPSSEP